MTRSEGRSLPLFGRVEYSIGVCPNPGPEVSEIGGTTRQYGEIRVILAVSVTMKVTFGYADLLMMEGAGRHCRWDVGVLDKCCERNLINALSLS